MKIGSLYESENISSFSRFPAAESIMDTDVTIVGGGLTGISAALHLAERGVHVVLLEAKDPGWGASGRNGGQINPGLKLSPDEVEQHFGEQTGKRLVDLAWNAPDLIFDLIKKHDIDCNSLRGGTLRAATNASQIKALKDLTDQCRKRNWPVSWLDQNAIQARTGTQKHVAAQLDARGGQIDPLAFTLGLAQAATKAGAQIHSNSPVARMGRKGATWHVETHSGSVIRSKNVVVATNGYSGSLIRPLCQSIVPVFSGIVASSELPPALRAQILSQGEVLYELGHITAYYRVDIKGRLLMGGRSFSHPAQGADMFPFLIDYAEKLWPALRNTVTWPYGWNGQLAITLDHFPHWHQPAPGLLATLGYNGRGVALATLTGREIARYLTDDAPPLFPFTPIKAIPFHSFWKIGVLAEIFRGRLLDKLSSL